MYQDQFYKKKEGNSFFNRWKDNNRNEFETTKKKIRPYKKKLLQIINSKINLNNKKVLEIGPFIGDLLWTFKKIYKCEVYGIEPSSLACSYAKKYYNLKIENSTILRSKLFNLKKENKGKFDIIICDDVLSWLDRECILSCIAVMDWMLKTNGHIFLRDFSPAFNFAYPNHHWRNEKIFNFKQKNGHAQFFLNSGKYSKIFYKKYITSKYQKISIKDKEGITWSDVIIKKIKKFTHPIKRIK
jgi:2-polyprenyl-3-methyl-5-hydroxy-6-metoxy-1,4-benzoquinol methylase